MFRIGIGYDLHRLVANHPLVLGGVRIPWTRGLLGHSDGDVVLHAVCDALLGAAGLGDIGEYFPDTDPRYAGADSREFVRRVRELVASRGWRPANVDVIVHAQEPRLGPYKESIRGSVAELLGLGVGQVGVKATTNEGLGEIGRGEAIACWAAVLLAGSDERGDGCS